jgi:hypothetical protein
VECEELGLSLRYSGELLLEDVGDDPMQVSLAPPQEHRVSSLLHQCVLEDVRCVRRLALNEYELRADKLIQPDLNVDLGLARDLNE